MSWPTCFPLSVSFGTFCCPAVPCEPLQYFFSLRHKFVYLYEALAAVVVVAPFCIQFFYCWLLLAKHISLCSQANVTRWNPKPKAEAEGLKLKPRRCCGGYRSIVLCLCHTALWLLRLKVVKLCGLINFVACCCGACFARLLPARSLCLRQPLNLRCAVAVAVVAAAQRQLLVVVAVDFGAAPVIHTASIPTSWMPAHLVASAARSCLVPLRHLHTDTQIHTHIRTPHATRFYLFEMTFIGFYVFIWNFIKND